MGMSASQARLLSLTTRLTNNELQSQMTTNAKLRLAEKSSVASKEYMQALDSQKLEFGLYNDNGDYIAQALTASVIYNYEPLKNQYSIQNSSRKNLVAALEAKNYEETDSLVNFLSRYGLVEDYTEEIENPEYAEWLKWQTDWQEREPVQEDYKKTISDRVETPTQKWVHTNSAAYDALSTKIDLCFYGAIGGTNCFMHVLAALIGVGEHTTSDGHTFEVHYKDDIDENGEKYNWNWNTYAQSEEIGDVIRASLYNDEVYDKSYDGELKTEAHDVVKCYGTGDDAAKYNSPEGGYCYQKAIDLLYSMKDNYECGSDGKPLATGGCATPENLAAFFYFIEFDLGDGQLVDDVIVEQEEVIVDDVERFEKDHDDWVAEGLKHPEPPETVPKVHITINDKDKGQWYTNLWYMMNGSETANRVTAYDGEEKLNAVKPLFEVLGAEKTTSKGNYEVLESNLASSPEWLQFALEHGIVTLSQAQFKDPSIDSYKVPELTSEAITWKSIIYTSAPDIQAKDDENAVTTAELKYKKKMNEIQSEDNRFDQDLRQLDTEHNALQNEYESLKSVINKNVERSFKVFS